MKKKQTIFAYVTAGLLFAGTANSFAANPAQTYSGTLNGGQLFCAGTPVPTPISSGFWTLSIDPNTPARVTLNVFYDGRHHLAFGYNALMLETCSGGVYTFLGFGDSATATLDTTIHPRGSLGTSNSAAAVLQVIRTTRSSFWA